MGFLKDMIDPAIAIKPHKWLSLGGLLNPNNPLNNDDEDD